MANKRILITGAKGFLGGVFANELSGHTLRSLDLKNSEINADLSTDIPDLKEAYDLVVHCAGKAHVIPKTKEQEEEFFKINYEGTKNLCKGIDKVGIYPESFVFISTVSVYGLDVGNNIKESTSLNGSTPYALSKIKGEHFVSEWSRKNDVNCLILRLPLIVGGRPPGNLGKMISAIQKRRFLQINGGQARKSMVVAHDLPALVVNNLDKSGIYNLTDGYHPSFKEIESTIAKASGVKGSGNLPLIFAKFLSVIGEVFPFFPFNKSTLRKMTLDLTFNDERAIEDLDWRPSKALEVLSKMDY